MLLLDMNPRLERVPVPEEVEEEASEDDEPPSAVSHPFFPFQPPATNPSQMLPQPPILAQSPILDGRTHSGGTCGGNVPNAAPPFAASSSGGPHIRKKGFGLGETQAALGNFVSPRVYLAPCASSGVSGCL